MLWGRPRKNPPRKNPLSDDKKKYGIHAGPPLRRLIEERAGPDCTPTRVVNATAARYLALLDRAAPRLSLAEWGRVIAALNRCDLWSDAPALAGLWHDRAVARALAGAPDGGTLLAKLQEMNYAETLAVVEIVERYRSRFDPNRPLAEALAQLGVEIAEIAP
jgi:hypothetical protein